MHGNEAEKLYDTILDECVNSRVFQSAILTGWLTSFLALVARESRAIRLTGADIRLPEQIHATMDHIEKHLQDEITLESLAGLANLSVSRYSELFRTHTGMSPIQYVLNVRLSAAQNLLLNSDLPVGTIADHLGFNSLQYFSRIFRRHIGTSPSEYRSESRAEKSKS
jgi:transcriptional regulator GlxA family with amidase domain